MKVQELCVKVSTTAVNHKLSVIFEATTEFESILLHCLLIKNAEHPWAVHNEIVLQGGNISFIFVL